MPHGSVPYGVQLPTDTQPELASGSSASRYTLWVPVKVEVKTRFACNTTEFPDGYASVYPTAHWLFESVAEEPIVLELDDVPALL
jgi:hypothetical protein